MRNSDNREPDTPIMVPIDMGSMGGMGVPMPQRNDRADLIDKIKPEAVLEIIRNKLMGKEMIAGKWVDVQALKERRLTDVGAWELANLMAGVAHIGMTISKFKLHEINKRAYSIAKTAQLMLTQNWIAYGLKNTAQFYYVHQIIFTTTLAILKQADEASIQELLKGTVQEQRNINYDRKESRTSKLKRSMGLE